MSFFRQAALLLPCGFLLGVLLFLLTHGRQDPGFGAYPFFSQWTGGALAATAPEARFVEQSILFFLPAYLMTLLFILFVVVAERGLLGRPEPARRGEPYRSAFGALFAGLFLLATAIVVWAGDRLLARLAPGSLVAPLLVAFAPYAGAGICVLPAAVLAAPFALLRKVDPT
ncbi:MAG: hypothetical protein ABI592_14890 [Acidobacteriota bacterium]